MEAFYGSWKMVSKAGLDDYMKALGLPDPFRDYINNMIGGITFSQDGDKISLKIKMYGTIVRSHALLFKLGEEFDEVSIDFRACKTVFNLEEGKLVELQKWEGKVAKTIFEIQDGKLILTLIFGDVASVSTFERT